MPEYLIMMGKARACNACLCCVCVMLLYVPFYT